MAFACPNCNKIMYPQDDGSCPFCGKNVRDEEPEIMHDNTIVVKHNQLLPDICCACGNKADTYVNIKCTHSTLSNLPIIGTIITIIMMLISPIVLFFKFSEHGRYDKVEIRMPICKNCKKTEVVEAEKVDLEEYEMTFIVHENLKKEFEKNKKYASYK